MLEIQIPRNYPHTNHDGDRWEWMAIQTIEENKKREIGFEIEKTRCFATFLVPISEEESKIELIPGYNLDPTSFHGDNVRWNCDRFDDAHLSPYRQLDIKIESEEVWCKEGLDKFWRDGNRPVCVSHNTKAELLHRGWGTLENQNN